MSKSIFEELSEERKYLQEIGELPDWYTTPGWQLFKEKYTYKNQSFKETTKRIAKAAAKHLPDEYKHYEQDFYDLIWKGWLSPSTPVLANMGTDRGCPVSCAGSYIEDSIHGFYSNQLETALLSKNGFGTSAYLGDIRPRGTPISKGGYASGVLPVLKDMIQLSRDVSQGSNRRGAWAGYLPIEHDDFFEILKYVEKNPDDCNIGWNISNNFIKRLDKGDPDALERYQKALKLKMITGKGYFHFIDKVNEQNPQVYKDNGIKVLASNLCLSGDTIIAIADGRNGITIKELAEYSKGVNKFPVYSAKNQEHDESKWQIQIKNAIAFKSGTKKVIKLKLNNGDFIKCTDDHKLATFDGKWIEALNSINIRLEYFYKDNFYDFTNDENNNIYVESIEDYGIEDVYDLTVEDNHNFYIFTSNTFDHGILVHNCIEIALTSDEDHTFTCVLASMNLEKYDEWKSTNAVFISTIFLDCVASEFIEIGSQLIGLEKAVRFTEKYRALGLGVLGYHSYLQKNMIPFESIDANYKNSEIFKHIHDESLSASKWMAEHFGEPELMRGYGLRNSHRIAIAPTLSSALLCGSVSQGIEPIYQNVFVQGSAGGEINRVNPYLIDIMKERDVYNNNTITDIINNKGSVQDVEWLSDDEKKVFKTAFEIDQRVIINKANARQRYICQGQSINLFFNSDEDESYISEIHKLAFKSKYIKGLYYIRSLAGVQASKNSCESCSN